MKKYIGILACLFLCNCTVDQFVAEQTDSGSIPDSGNADSNTDAIVFDGGSEASADVDATIDTSGDGKNCGSIGHDCLGGSCLAGKCQPITLAEGQGQPHRLAIDSKNVYWTNTFTGTVMQCAAGGCNKSPVTLVNSQASPFGIVTDGVDVYWTNTSSGEIRKCSTNGCLLSSTLLVGNQSVPFDIVLKGSFLYWTNSGGGTAGNKIMRCNVGNCSGTLSIVADQQDPYPLAASATNVYWSNLSAHKIVMCAGAGSCGTNPQTVFSPTALVQGLAADSTSIYMADSNSGTITKCSQSGCGSSPIVLASNLIKPYQLIVNGTNVYWTNMGDGTIMSIPVTGGSPATVASNQATPEGIVSDDVSVYWVNSGTGSVMRIAK